MLVDWTSICKGMKHIHHWSPCERLGRKAGKLELFLVITVFMIAHRLRDTLLVVSVYFHVDWQKLILWKPRTVPSFFHHHLGAGDGHACSFSDVMMWRLFLMPVSDFSVAWQRTDHHFLFIDYSKLFSFTQCTHTWDLTWPEIVIDSLKMC